MMQDMDGREAIEIMLDKFLGLGQSGELSLQRKYYASKTTLNTIEAEQMVSKMLIIDRNILFS